MSEVEHQANEGKSIGFAALEELKKIRKMADDGIIYVEIQGRRPADWQIKRAKSGEIDEIIRMVAFENDATLVTGDQIQRDIALIKGIKVEYIAPDTREPKNIEEFFDEVTSSVHLKAEMEPVLKRGPPGEIKYEKLHYKITRGDLEEIANHIVKRGRNEDDSFIEMDARGATVIQLHNIRIVITRPPFSNESLDCIYAAGGMDNTYHAHACQPEIGIHMKVVCHSHLVENCIILPHKKKNVAGLFHGPFKPRVLCDFL